MDEGYQKINDAIFLSGYRFLTAVEKNYELNDQDVYNRTSEFKQMFCKNDEFALENTMVYYNDVKKYSLLRDGMGRGIDVSPYYVPYIPNNKENNKKYYEAKHRLRLTSLEILQRTFQSEKQTFRMAREPKDTTEE